MPDAKKMPGVLSDPWRRQQPSAPPERPKVTPPAPTEVDNIEEDLQDAKYATIELVGYGGITAEGTANTRVCASRLLNFCVEHQKQIEPILLEYGVVLTKLDGPPKPHVRFFIQRQDRWTLAIPNVKSRDEGALQLIQAMLQVQAEPAMREKMRAAKLHAYKM